MKKIKCYIEAVLYFLKSGIWCPHVYVDTREYNADIFANDKSWRFADTWEHNLDETLYENVTITESECKYCGKKSVSWTLKNK